MVQVEADEISYGSWGRCVRLSNGTFELIATLDFGPRIIRFGMVDGENEFYEDTEDLIQKEGFREFDIFGDEGYWHIYGGHRLWTAPEQFPRSYYPDNEPVEYTTIENGIRLTPPPQAWTELQLEMDIKVVGKNQVEVTHKITNIGAWDATFAPWALTVMKAGGLQVIPQNLTETDLLPNRLLVLWPYTQMNDPRVCFGDHFITLRPDAANERAFKIGTDNMRGYAAYFNHGNLFVKRYAPVDGGNYPDGGVSYETYTKGAMVELETLGEYKTVPPSQTQAHVETWELYPNVAMPQTDEQIHAAIAKYIEK